MKQIDIDKAIRVVSMPLADKILLVNSYITSNNLDEDWLIHDEIKLSIPAQVAVDRAVIKILTPHEAVNGTA